MNFSIGRTMAAVAGVLACTSASRGGAESFEQLASRVPREANAIVVIDVEQTLAAPLAKSQGWAQKLEAASADRPVMLPPEAKKLVLGASLSGDREFRCAWEVGVMELSEP